MAFEWMVRPKAHRRDPESSGHWFHEEGYVPPPDARQELAMLKKEAAEIQRLLGEIRERLARLDDE